MKLRIATPTEIVVDADDVLSLRAEDLTGGFGVQTGHADCVTVLPVSLVSWSDTAGRRWGCAVHGGVLSVAAGKSIDIAAREAIASADIDKLERDVLAGMRAAQDQEKRARVDSLQLQLRAIRHMVRMMQESQVASPWSES